MTYTAPNLTTTIGTSTYQVEIDENFRLTNKALYDIHNEMRRKSSRVAFKPSQNGAWIADILAGQNALIGNTGFLIAFNTDDTITVSHPSQGSSCFIDKTFYTTTTDVTADLNTLAPSDGTWRVVIAANSGDPAPLMTTVIQQSDDTDDGDFDLVLYSMDIIRAGSLFTPLNIRREAHVLPDVGHSDELLELELPMKLFYTEAVLPGNRNIWNEPQPFPLDCEILSCACNVSLPPDLGTDPNISFEVILNRGSDTDAELLVPNPFEFTVEDALGPSLPTLMKFQNGFDPPVLAREITDKLWVNVLEYELALPDLLINTFEFRFKVRRVYHPIMP